MMMHMTYNRNMILKLIREEKEKITRSNRVRYQMILP